MGAVDSHAPHYCNSGHVCDSPADLMKAVAEEGDTLSSATLDVGRDDYYGHSGTWFDVQDNGLLYRLDLTLPPAPAVTATATSVGGTVRVAWSGVTADSNVAYRVYDANGKILQDDSTSAFTVDGAVGQIFTWTIRGEDAGGFLGPATTVRFKKSGAVWSTRRGPSPRTRSRRVRSPGSKRVGRAPRSSCAGPRLPIRSAFATGSRRPE